MFRKIFIIFFLFAAISMVSCQRKSVESKKMQLTVSIIPQRYLVNFIAGDKCDVQVMLPTGSNPKTYKPVTRDMGKISE